MSDRPLLPNFTAIPNMVLEKLMPGLSKAALKVLLAVARKTYGFHKERDAISLTQLQTLTGLGRAGVVRGINELGSLSISSFASASVIARVDIMSSSRDTGLPFSSSAIASPI
jgi:phage replication O-like protein O